MGYRGMAVLDQAFPGRCQVMLQGTRKGLIFYCLGPQELIQNRMSQTCSVPGPYDS